MSFRRLLKPQFLVLIALMGLLVTAISCGDDEPAPAATTAPVPTEAPKATNTPAPEPTAKPAATTAPAATKAPAATATPKPLPTKMATPTPTAVPTPVPTPTPGHKTSVVDQLVVAQPFPPREQNLIMLQGSSWGVMRGVFETLVGTDRYKASYEPRLATKWAMSPDGKKWTVDLRDDVAFHNPAYGNFTSADAAHSLEQLTAQDSLATDRRNLRAEVYSTELASPTQLILNMGDTNPEFEFRMSTRVGNWGIMSKGQWDAEGIDGLRDNPVGTGPWKWNNWRLGDSMLFDRVEGHWRKTPEFRQLRIAFVSENSTRLAMMLVGEAHIADLPKDLHEEAMNSGMTRTTAPGSQHPLIYFFGGLYFLQPDKYQGPYPVSDVRVREALNRAIDREEIIDTIYGGQGKPAYFHFNHPTQPGWDETWATRAPEAYAYDPVKASQLIEDAGFKGAEIVIYNYMLPGTPEMVQVQEAMEIAFDAIGLNAKLEDIEFNRVREKYRGRSFLGEIFGFNPGSLRPPHIGYSSYYDTNLSFINLYDDLEINAKMAELRGTLDYNKRAQIQADIGEILLMEYTTMPILYVSAQMIVNPSVVSEYAFSGLFNQAGDFEYAVAAQNV